MSKPCHWAELLSLRYYSFVFWNKDTSTAQFFIGLAGVFWATMLFLPGDPFAREFYALMAEFMSEQAWATFFLLHGIYMILMSTRLFRIPHLVELVVTLTGCVLWSGSAISMVISVYPPPAVAAELALAIASWWVLVRAECPTTHFREANK